MGSWGSDVARGAYCERLRASCDVACDQDALRHARPPIPHPGRRPQTHTRPREGQVDGEPRAQKTTKSRRPEAQARSPPRSKEQQ
eukprot:9046143-Alexandrium_andersonii.AAC.1